MPKHLTQTEAKLLEEHLASVKVLGGTVSTVKVAIKKVNEFTKLDLTSMSITNIQQINNLATDLDSYLSKVSEVFGKSLDYSKPLSELLNDLESFLESATEDFNNGKEKALSCYSFLGVCTNCDGDGKVYDYSQIAGDPYGRSSDAYVPCGVCKGEGKFIKGMGIPKHRITSFWH